MTHKTEALTTKQRDVAYDLNVSHLSHGVSAFDAVCKAHSDFLTVETLAFPSVARVEILEKLDHIEPMFRHDQLQHDWDDFPVVLQDAQHVFYVLLQHGKVLFAAGGVDVLQELLLGLCVSLADTFVLSQTGHQVGLVKSAFR